MTCIVGIAHEGRVLLGGDSAATSYDDHEIHIVGTSKVFRRGAYAIGYTTSFRVGNLLEHQIELPEPPPETPTASLENFIVSGVVPCLQKSFETAGWTDDLSPAGTLLLGVQGRLFGLGAHLQVLWLQRPYTCIGAGRHVAYGALHALEDSPLPPRAKAERALRAAQQFVPGVRGPFTFIEI